MIFYGAKLHACSVLSGLTMTYIGLQ